ncbi:MAG: hypothetical protein IEMM0002_1198 [bacterium]|nr:MAG: hypothetical protein IEMM0002_1198 [bacterium]
MIDAVNDPSLDAGEGEGVVYTIVTLSLSKGALITQLVVVL